eukprot:Gb_12206 [translate_table: standard]
MASATKSEYDRLLDCVVKVKDEMRRMIKSLRQRRLFMRSEHAYKDDSLYKFFKIQTEKSLGLNNGDDDAYLTLESSEENRSNRVIDEVILATCSQTKPLCEEQEPSRICGKTLEECESALVQEDMKRYVTSIEAMVEFVVSILGLELEVDETCSL